MKGVRTNLNLVKVAKNDPRSYSINIDLTCPVVCFSFFCRLRCSWRLRELPLVLVTGPSSPQMSMEPFAMALLRPRRLLRSLMALAKSAVLKAAMMMKRAAAVRC